MLTPIAESTVVKAFLQLIPGGIGSSLDVFLTAGAQMVQQERLRNFLDELGTGDIPLNEETARSNDYTYAFFRCAQGAAASARNEKARLFARAFKSWSTTDTPDVDLIEETVSVIDTISYREWQALLLFDELIGERPEAGQTAKAFQRAWPVFVKRAEMDLGIPADESDTYLLRLGRAGLYRSVVGIWFDDDTGAKPGTLTPAFYRLKAMLLSPAPQTIYQEDDPSGSDRSS